MMKCKKCDIEMERHDSNRYDPEGIRPNYKCPGCGLIYGCTKSSLVPLGYLVVCPECHTSNLQKKPGGTVRCQNCCEWFLADQLFDFVLVPRKNFPSNYILKDDVIIMGDGEVIATLRDEQYEPDVRRLISAEAQLDTARLEKLNTTDSLNQANKVITCVLAWIRDKGVDAGAEMILELHGGQYAKYWTEIKTKFEAMKKNSKISHDNFLDARAAMDLIRREVANCAPPGSTVNVEELTPEFTVDAEDICRGVHAMYEKSQHIEEVVGYCISELTAQFRDGKSCLLCEQTGDHHAECPVLALEAMRDGKKFEVPRTPTGDVE